MPWKEDKWIGDNFSWEGAPSSLRTVDLSDNKLESFTWEGAPSSLQTVSLFNNKLESFSWEGASSSLQTVDLSYNKLESFSWEGAPSSLQTVRLHNNKLESFSWEGAPSSLQIVWLYNNKVSKVSGFPPFNCTVHGLIKEIHWDLFSESSNECLICWEKENVISLHRDHSFHKECLISWFATQKNELYPLCFKHLD